MLICASNRFRNHRKIVRDFT